jgi:hypothetical protein
MTYTRTERDGRTRARERTVHKATLVRLHPLWTSLFRRVQFVTRTVASRIPTDENAKRMQRSCERTMMPQA